MLTISASFVNICWNEHSLKISMMLWFRGVCVCVCVSHLCSFLRCGPARSRSRRCSETFPAGSDTIRTHRCSGSYTRRCLPDDTHTEDRVSVCYCKRVCVSLCVCVFTLAGLAVFSRREAHLTLAAISSRRVQTLTVLTQIHVISALIHVCREIHKPPTILPFMSSLKQKRCWTNKLKIRDCSK